MSYFKSLRIKRNVIATAIQAVISGLVLFILYRYLYNMLGIEQIGIWSLVLATTSISLIGDFGLSAGVVRYVAEALGRNDTERAANVVQTVVLTLGLFMGMLLIIGYPLFVFALGYLLPAHSVPIALSILPYAIMSLWVMVVVGVISGGLDGCMRMDLRSLFMGLSNLGYLGLTMLLVPRYGLEGVAIAQLLQSFGLMVLLWWMLRQQLTQLPLIPLHWKFPLLKEMFGYGANVQIISVISMLFDPVVKVLMSKFGGLAALGYYQMANKLILQVRSIIVEASRVIVPAVATLQMHDSDKNAQFIITSYRLTFYVAVLFYGLLGIGITAISLLWIGHYQVMFIQFALILNIGWFTNTLIGPAYFFNLGSGKLRSNMISQVIIVIGSIVLGTALGSNYGGMGVVIGTTIGLIAGSVFLLNIHFKQAGLSWFSIIIPRDMIKLLILSISTVFLSNYGRDTQSPITVVIGISLMCTIPLLFMGWFNPARMILLHRGNT